MARHKTGRHTEIPTPPPPPPYSYLARPYPERALRDDHVHYGVPVTYIWAQCICFLVSGPMLHP